MTVWGCLISEGLARSQKPFWTQSGLEERCIQYRETVIIGDRGAWKKEERVIIQTLAKGAPSAPNT